MLRWKSQLVFCSQKLSAKYQPISLAQSTADAPLELGSLKWCLKSQWRYHKAKGQQVCLICVCENKKERGRVRDPSLWEIRSTCPMKCHTGVITSLFYRENEHILMGGWVLRNQSLCLGGESMLYYFWLIKQSELAISPARTSHAWLHIIHRD